MTIDYARTRKYLKSFQFKGLFTQELGWNSNSTHLEVTVDSHIYSLTGCAEKRAMVVFECPPGDHGTVPDYQTRRRIETQVAKSYHEHLVIYVDATRTTQVWQWVRREVGKPTACREHRYYVNQPGDSLIQKLEALAFSLVDEEVHPPTIVDVVHGVRAAFDVERVTKRFYDRFKAEHSSFLSFIKGIPEGEMTRWYASVMLNRLMFIYFIQKKHFMNNDTDYLRTKLRETKEFGNNRFYSSFLRPLFFEGFAKREKERSDTVNRLLGSVPYLNGGLFLRHTIEELYDNGIEISDLAFESVFDFFDQYQWRLDERPLRDDNEINPDVLGYIFEKYINQRQMGAYYSKEDITGYMTRNTVIPFVLEEARKKLPTAFEGENAVWKLMHAEPDRYIYSTVIHGVREELPRSISEGIQSVGKRTGWNETASDKYGLATETWREVIQRRNWYHYVREKMETGELNEIDQLVTYNVNTLQFAQDIIQNCAEPELLRVFWSIIVGASTDGRNTSGISVLDPTCGSGAFLFATLTTLQSLYEACLERMEAFVSDHDAAGRVAHEYNDFREVLDRVARHPNRSYFVLKSIIVNNLYGVDIIDEAVEICKLRLFLKLVAQIEHVDQIEPLPDIDFNIRAGNSLVGFATQSEVKEAITTAAHNQMKIVSEKDLDTMARINKSAEMADLAFHRFQQMQIDQRWGARDLANAKTELRHKLTELHEELTRYLASEYGIDTSDQDEYRKWCSTYKPFHWFVDFFGIMKKGGFDIIVGNPPYLELNQVDYKPRHFRCLETRAVHALCIERSLALMKPDGYQSMIVPMALVSTQRMKIVHELLHKNRGVWYANFAWRPGKLFDTVNRALTIFLAMPTKNRKIFSTAYQKWTSDTRDRLMSLIRYTEVPSPGTYYWVPKLSSPIERSILKKCLSIRSTLGKFEGEKDNRIYYRTTGGLYWKVFTDHAPTFRINGKPSHSSRETWISVLSKKYVIPLIAILSSDVFWWWYTISSTLRDLNPYDIQSFPVPQNAVDDERLTIVGSKYLQGLKQNSTMLQREQTQTGRTETQSFKVRNLKNIIEEIDSILKEHYHLTDEELDYVSNYDIKFRMGSENTEDSET